MSKDLSYNVCSHYLSSDQWLNFSVAEEFTYEEYCISAKNNNMTIATQEQWDAEVAAHEDLVAHMRADQAQA